MANTSNAHFQINQEKSLPKPAYKIYKNKDDNEMNED